MIDYREFSKQIKEKYPQYKDVDDLKLAKAMIEKYPVYAEQVSFDNSSKQVRPRSKGVDLTPSGIPKMISAGILSPIEAVRTKTSIPEAYQNVRNEINTNSAYQHPVRDFATDMWGYAYLPVLRGGGALNFAGNAVIQGGIPGGLETLKQGGNVAEGAGIGTGIAGAIQGVLPPALKVAGAGTSKFVNSNFVKNTLPKVYDVLTSVPAEYTERAIEKELAGNSILDGKFDVKTAYQPIEQKLRQAKEMLPTAADFGNSYYELGQKATKGMQNLKNQAADNIANALNKLDNKIAKNGSVKAAVDTVLNNFGEGGVYNTAREDAPQIVNYINDKLGREGLTLRDLHRVKERLYDKGYAAQGAKDGITADVARGTAEQINNYLRGAVPEYAKPNDIYSMILDVERGLDNTNTIGSKIKKIGSTENAVSGLDQRLKNIDNLLPQQDKFYKSAQDLINSENEINEIRNVIGNQYERNPRLLANRNDIRFENALDDLQTKTGVKFMDELNDIRAREALEKVFPGQGGGSGSEQGFMNNVVRPIINTGGRTAGAAILGNYIGGPIGAGLGLLSVSPKFMTRGTIRNLGKLKNFADDAISGAYDNLLRRLSPLGVKTVTPLLYGGISNTDDEEY